ncbi:hypothetical protein G6F57_011319 [Rhizopus arrhizus]|nr:hypothetical protein G6F57_011319 [Rhizopus arrhizus]
MEHLKSHYITPELIQNYELEFNDMIQGDQEHPQIFLSRLREAADLANITSEAIIESRFRAGLLRDIKQFCIQSSARTFQDWLNHAEGWWNANRPRKVAMVDNPFIPRNINNALIYHDEDNYRNHYAINNHNIEIIDTDEIPTQVVTINGTSKPTRMMHRNIISGPTRLTTMDINGHTNGVQYQVHHRPRLEYNEPAHPDSQHEILNMVQQVIRNELNGFYQPNRSYNRNPVENPNKYNNNYRDYRRNNEHNGYQNNNGNGYNNKGYNNNNNNNGYGNRNSYNNNGYNKFRNNIDYVTKPAVKKLDGSVVFNNEINGQSNTHHNKPINQSQLNQHQYQNNNTSPQQSRHLNAILTQNESDSNNKRELYAAVRPEKPPEVAKGVPYKKTRPTPQEKQTRTPVITRKVSTRQHFEEINPSTTNQIVTNKSKDMDIDLPVKEMERKTPRQRLKREQPDISYNIVNDVLEQPAKISVRDLITTTPKFRRELISACRPKRKIANKQVPQQTMSLIEDDDINTTAVYSKVNIGNHRVKTLVDCGAAKTYMSKALADTLELSIDAASESVFTLGNGTKQPALGIIYDVPIEVKEDMIITCTIEVLPTCPSHLIIGNNWLNRAKAKIDFNSSSLKVSYKKQKAELPISFLRRKESVPKMISHTQTYQNPVSMTNSSPKRVHFEDESYESDSTESDDSEEISESDEVSDEDYTAENESSEEELPQEQIETSLLVLDKNMEQYIELVPEEKENIVRAPKDGVVLKAFTINTFRIDKPPGNHRKLTYNFNVINKHISEAMGYFDINSNIIINKRNVEIHIYNRSGNNIYLKPHEEIGVLEEYDLENEEMIQAYQLNKNYDLFVMEKDVDSNEDTENETIDQDAYAKLEIGKIGEMTEKKLRKLIYKYKEIFDWNNDTIGCTQLTKHKIIIEENIQSISHRPYRLSPIESEYLQKELEKYCKLGVIAPSNSPWSAPVILVKKKNGEYRMVIDYRKLNAVTKKDSYPLPRIDDLLDTLGKAKVFSALDMRAGFHQVPMEEESKELTAFTTKFGVYHYNTLPMGLVNSPATFQRLIDLCFRPLLNRCLVAYIDDLNVYSNDNHEHLLHLEQVFNCIKIANLKLNPEKCFFFKDHLKFLGYIVTKEGIQTDPSKIEKIQNYPVPKTLTQIRGFLGLATYYRRFIKNFAAIARPLHDQIKTSKRIPWTNKATESFELLKKLLTQAPVLARPDFNRDFILVTGASRNGLGCILTQLDENNHEHPIIYASRSLKSSEGNYGVSKLECLAVIWAVKLFRPYLLGRKFTIITDHSALKGLLNSTNPTGIIARWITILAEYEYEIKYRPGRVNESADFMSRLGY